MLGFSECVVRRKARAAVLTMNGTRRRDKPTLTRCGELLTSWRTELPGQTIRAASRLGRDVAMLDLQIARQHEVTHRKLPTGCLQADPLYGSGDLG